MAQAAAGCAATAAADAVACALSGWTPTQPRCMVRRPSRSWLRRIHVPAVLARERRRRFSLQAASFSAVSPAWHNSRRRRSATPSGRLPLRLHGQLLERHSRAARRRWNACCAIEAQTVDGLQAAVSAVAPEARGASRSSRQTAPAPAAAKRAPTSPTGSLSVRTRAEDRRRDRRRGQIKAVRQACTLNDFMAHCSWITPEQPRVLLCLKANAADLSPACQSALQSVPGRRRPQRKRQRPRPRNRRPPRRPPRSPRDLRRPERRSERAPQQRPPQTQTSAIRAACRSDFMSHCAGVQPGGAEALQCLQTQCGRVVHRHAEAQSPPSARSGAGGH